MTNIIILMTKRGMEMNSIKEFELAEMINKLELFKNRVRRDDLKLRYEIVIRILNRLLND